MRFLLSILCTLLTFPVLAQNSTTQTTQLSVTLPPEAVGFSTERLERMESTLRKYVDEEKTAGILSMVARRGEIIHFKTYGKRDLKAGLPMKHDTIFRIYSMTKPITSVAVMMLYEQGYFQLSDPVHRYIPAFEGVMVYDEDASDDSNEVKPAVPITIAHLLSHSSGLTYGIFGNSPVDVMYREAQVLNPNQSLEEMVEKLAEIPLVHHPGEKWTYGVSTDVLGYFVEVISGVSLGTYLERNLFKPLRMEDTSFYVPEEKIDRFASNYTIGPDGSLVVQDDRASTSFMNPGRMESGGGGLVSTASDYMRFAQMVLNGGGP